MQAVKSKGSIKNLEDDLLKTAAKEAKGIEKAATILSHSYKDRDEKKLRDKLVTKLKKKEEDKISHFNQKIKNVMDGKRGVSYESEMEDISDDDLEAC